MTKIPLDQIEKAKKGDTDALEALIRGTQDRVHALAMRILGNPDDAAEATQEILIVLITKLSTFEGRSSFETWVYRVAVNHLISVRKKQANHSDITFEEFREDLHAGLSVDPAPLAEDTQLLNELRVSCTMAMLLCLDLNHRLAYVLGDIFEFDHRQAAVILQITPENFRKRLSRARKDVHAFTMVECGLASPDAACSCPRRLNRARELGRIDEVNTPLSKQATDTYSALVEKVARVEGELCALTLHRAVPTLPAPRDFTHLLTDILA